MGNKLASLGLAVVGTVGLLAGLGPSASRAETILVAPPELKVEIVPPRPPGRPVELLEWDRGHWARAGGGWGWIPGHWIERPRPGAVWVVGHWDRRGPEYIWIDGHWR